MDTAFDGVTQTQPNGIIHIVAGGGGGTLYRGDLQKNSELFQAKWPDNWASFTARFVTDRHSFAVVELTPTHLLLRALDATGAEIDRCTITKPVTAPGTVNVR